MRNQTPLEELSSKILLIIEKFNTISQENIELKKELEELKQTLSEKDTLLTKLKEDNEVMNLEIEDINKKITLLLS